MSIQNIQCKKYPRILKEEKTIKNKNKPKSFLVGKKQREQKKNAFVIEGAWKHVP